MDINEIKKRLLDINDGIAAMNNPWNEGYLSACTDYKIINDGEFEILMHWLKTGE